MSAKQKFHGLKPTRLKEYDYSNVGWYYVTICTQKHAMYFGRVKNKEIQKNVLGKIADKYWKEIPKHFPEVELDEYIIMPNHIHGIIIINDVVGDAKFASPTDRTKMTLSKVIQQFKRAVTIEVKTSFPKSNFRWQRSFYDRIIRNDKELYFIRRYIKQNPLKWEFEQNIDNLDI
jgi:putative transposase